MMIFAQITGVIYKEERKHVHPFLSEQRSRLVSDLILWDRVRGHYAYLLTTPVHPVAPNPCTRFTGEKIHRLHHIC